MDGASSVLSRLLLSFSHEGILWIKSVIERRNIIEKTREESQHRYDPLC